MTLKILLVTLGVAVMLAPTACAEPAPQNAGESPVVRQVFDQQTNVPGKSLISVTVSYPPGTKVKPTITRSPRSSWPMWFPERFAAKLTQSLRVSITRGDLA